MSLLPLQLSQSAAVDKRGHFGAVLGPIPKMAAAGLWPWLRRQDVLCGLLPGVTNGSSRMSHPSADLLCEVKACLV